MAKRPAAKAAKPARPQTASHTETANGFPIVGIGASAGGLEAVTRLLRALPTDNPMALVLVQHLDPHHESMLVDILSRETTLPVRQVEDGMKAEPRKLYVIPPNATMELTDGSFRIARPRRRSGHLPLPVDEFFMSLAQTRKSASIGVVLSGNASDGMLGMRAIKAEGGITFAQDESAQFQGMPRAAILAGAADFVLPPEEIARELDRVAKHPFVYAEKGKEDRPDEETLQNIFGLVRTASGVDFSTYRQTTILRRLARRMAVNKIVSFPEYLELLRKAPAEVSALYDDFLISVTSFFRDPATFSFLSSKVFPKILRERPRDQPVRIWVPGCATGEEAYSLAICLVEAMDPSRPVEAQVFATDVSEQAIDHARHALYPESALLDVSAERRRRFFVRVDGHFQVAKSVRDLCIFARQNVATDPPFSRLDLLSCRNLLIYLEPTLQRKLFPLFHHALNPTGYLILGPSESAAPFGDLFAPVDKRHRVFVKRIANVPAPLAITRQPFGPRGRTEVADARGRAESVRESRDFLGEVDRALIGRYAPPAAVINSNLEIVQFRGKTGMFLEPPSGAANLNILSMAREGLLPDLREAISKARRRDVRVRKEGVRVRSNGGFRTVNLEVVPLRSHGPQGRLYLVVFEPLAEKKSESQRSARPARGAESAGRDAPLQREVERLTGELSSTREYLQSMIEEQESTNEELKSANEEILSSNEELQSTNEELDTAKEELQASNEELTTLNEELQNRNLQLARANDDLLNLLHSVQIPILMLGATGQIRRFTPSAEKLLNLIPGDVGRPIANIRPNVDIPNLPEIVLDAASKLTPRQLEIQDRAGRWHLLRIEPYRTLENRIDGVVLAFVDIHLQKTAELEASRAREFSDWIFETVPEAVLVLDDALRVKRANNAFHRLFRTSAQRTVGEAFLDLGGGHWNTSEVREALERPERVELEIERDFEGIGRRVMLLRKRRGAIGESGMHVVLSIDDVTAQRRAQVQLQSSEEQYRGFFDSTSAGSLVLDAGTGRIQDVNRYMTEFLGVPRDRFLGKAPWELPFVSGAESLRAHIGDAGTTSTAPLSDIAITNARGDTVFMEAVQKIFLPGGRTQITLTDVTHRRRLEAELRQAQKMESIGRLAGGMAHDFNNILNIISAYAETLSRAPERTKVVEGSKAIAKAVERGAGVVRQLLTFARKDESAFRAASINDVLKDAVLIVGETFPKNVRVETELADGLPAIMADSDQLHQALLNLFVNARDAMPQGGVLRLSTAEVDQAAVRERFPEATAGSYVRVEVADTGEGMDRETQRLVFEPFFTTKERGAGSGLGLAVVYGVVSAHRGFVEIESEERRGTRVRLFFPAVSARPAAGPARARSRGKLRRGTETILLVEDEPMLLESVRELLEQEGYTVFAARTGEEALRIFSERGPEIRLLVTDVELPDISGWDAFRQIHESDPDVRAIMVSGYLDPPMRARMLEGGAKGFLRKPYVLEELLRTMREVLDDKPPARAGKRAKEDRAES